MRSAGHGGHDRLRLSVGHAHQPLDWGAADAEARVRLARARRGAGTSADGDADVAGRCPKLARPHLRVRLSRHAAPGPDLPDLLRPWPIQPDLAGAGAVDLRARAVLVRPGCARTTVRDYCQRAKAAGIAASPPLNP